MVENFLERFNLKPNLSLCELLCATVDLVFIDPLGSRVGQSVESALIALAAIFFWLIAHILTIFDKKYCILTSCDKRESYLIVLQQNNV